MTEMTETTTPAETTDDDTREYADIEDVKPDDDGIALVLFDDGSQIDMTQASEDGSIIGLGKTDGFGWGEVALTWAALQIIADELNAQLRQARINSWI